MSSFVGDGVNEGGQRIRVAEYYIHEGYYNDMLEPLENDIAILRLEEKINLTNRVGMIEWRDSPTANYDGEVGIVIGWGATGWAVIPDKVN